MIVFVGAFGGVVLLLGWLIDAMGNLFSLIRFLPVLFGEGSSDELIPLGVGDLLI